MGDGTEPITKLDAETVKRFSREVGECTTTISLNRLTRRIWRTYEGPANGVALDQLKARIMAQRAVIARNDPR